MHRHRIHLAGFFLLAVLLVVVVGIVRQITKEDSVPTSYASETPDILPNEVTVPVPTVEEQSAADPEPAAEQKNPEPAIEQKAKKPLLVVIDPGHQASADSGQEPIGPNAQETKNRVTGGTTGCVTGISEYELNLAVSLYLREELTQRGYAVLLTRESADVNISNAERAKIANAAGADIFLRIHANGSEDPAAEGALTMCMTPSNPYCASQYENSRLLSETVLQGLCSATGTTSRGVMETDTMSGINWCLTPVTIIEMGFMTNPEEDARMAEDSFRRRIAYGIADGVDAFFENSPSYSDDALRKQAETILEKCAGNWSVYASTLSGERAVAFGEGAVISASLIKLFIMVSVYKAEYAGMLEHETVYPLLRSMITVSDNDAANALIELLGNGSSKRGMEKVNEDAFSMGFFDTKLNRRMLEDNGQQNYTSARDCAALLRSICEKKCVSPEYSEEMLALLSAQQVNNRIPAKLPQDAHCAHKTGDLIGLSCGDVGVVFSGDTDYLICAICENPSDDFRAAMCIADLSELIYRAYTA